MVLLKYLTKFWRTLEMSLINCEICLQLKQSIECFLVGGTAANQAPEIKIADKKLYVSVVTLSTQDSIKLLKQLESGFKKMNRNKYQSNKTNQVQNRYIDFLTDPNIQGVNRLFVLLFKDNDCRES